MASINKFRKALLEVAAEKNFWLKVLGVVDEYEMWLVRTREIYPFDHKDPRILIVAGFHGEEKAGPLAVLRWLQECGKEILEKVDISLIPVVNSFGFARNKRYGSSMMKTNCGFCHLNNDISPSPEGVCLINHIELLRPLAQDGFLSLHEDATVKEFYLYTFEHGNKPGKFTRGLQKELKRFFPKAYNGIAYADAANAGAGPECKNGLVYKYCDGSFEDWMFHLGVPRVAVTETPGKYILDRRIKANVSVINKFIELCGKELHYDS